MERDPSEYRRERVYLRCVALMERFEAHARAKLGGREFSRIGAWLGLNAEALRGGLRKRLWNYPVSPTCSERLIDDFVMDLLNRYATVPIEDVQLPARGVEVRSPMLQARTEDLPAMDSSPEVRSEDYGLHSHLTDDDDFDLPAYL